MNNFITPRPFKPEPLHAHQREPLIQVEASTTGLVIATLCALCLVVGFLFGALYMRDNFEQYLFRCEQQFGGKCIVTAVPISP